MKLQTDFSYLSQSLNLKKLQGKVNKFDADLTGGNSIYQNKLGWMQVFNTITKEELQDISSTANYIRNNCDILVVIGIGGSYLGAAAIIELLKGKLYNLNHKPEIIFAGTSLSSLEIQELLDICQDKDIMINMVSKSGTTLEPNVVFDVFKRMLEKKYGKKEAAKRIICTTDKEKGDLRQLANKNKYKCFVIPDDIGGRYSVLTPVGLLPIAVAGVNIEKLLIGAGMAAVETRESDIDLNECYQYACARYLLYKKGYTVEMFAGFEPRMKMFGEWLKQLFGESEGKNGKGLFPASVIYTSDLHSLGQYLQDGKKTVIETILWVENIGYNFDLGKTELVNTNGKNLNEINEIAMLATAKAHKSGKTPVIILKLKEYTEECVGYMIYFFQKACAMYCRLLGVNPFNQDGVDAYKNNMKEMIANDTLNNN